jgi:peroxiredoxin (alkyl hydroperoxide reductase subunit C)
MKRLIVMCAVTILSSAAVVNASSHSPAVSEKHVRPSHEVGSIAPAFTLDAVENLEFRKISLSDFRGKWVVLFFYPGDFTFVCPTEIKGFNKALGEFKAANTEILAVSVDSKFSHLAWIKSGALDKLDFPLLSDLSKQTARAYGVLDEETSYARRGLFIIDPNGVIQYRIVHSDKVGRSVEETLRVLKALQTEELCPINWKPGDKTIRK